MVHLMGYKWNSQLATYLRAHPHLENRRFKPKRAVVYRATKWRLRDRLTEKDIVRLIMAFKTGMAMRDLAERYGINVKSVRKLLREHGVKRQSRYDQPR
jgi:hypothetical protein